MTIAHFEDFHKKFVDFSDKVTPFLSSAEQSVAIQIFSRTIGCWKKSADISLDELIFLTNLTRPPLTKAITKLKQKNVIRELEGPSRWKATTYEFIWPIVFTGRKESLHKGSHLPFPHRKSATPLCDQIPVFDVEQRTNENNRSILDQLNAAGLRLVETIYNAMDESEKRRYRIEAIKSSIIGTSVDVRIKELIAEREIGSFRLTKYRKWE